MILVLRYGNLSCEYSDERDVAHMLPYVRRISGDPVVNLETARDVHDFLDAHRKSVILAGDSVESDLMEAYTLAASQLHDLLPFGFASTTDAIQQLGFDEVPSLSLHRSDDRAVIEFPLAFSITTDFILGWIRDNLRPRYRARDSAVFRDLAFTTRPVLLAFVDVSRRASMDLVHETLLLINTQFGDALHLIYCDIFDTGTEVLQLGFSGAREPVYCLVDFSSGDASRPLSFPERKKPTPDAVAQWLSSSGSNRIVRKIADQPGPLFEIVDEDIPTLLFQPGIDVLMAVLINTENDRVKSLVEKAAAEFARQNVTTVKFYCAVTTKQRLPGLGLSVQDNSFLLLRPADEERVKIIQDFQDAVGIMRAVVRMGTTRPKFVVPDVEVDEDNL
jgi:hypothetical protein